MTRLYNDPGDFRDEALAGMVAAYPQYLAPVHGGAVRSTVSPHGQVALVVGGGSGHYPAFTGWVGGGMAHGAVCGNVFASPSASQIVSVARAANNGGGILLGYGRYAGDVLHFGQAAERLRAEGIDVRTVAVSDDVASAPADQARRRRGVCGDLAVFKIAGAAAERGYPLDRVEQLAWRVNDQTKSIGVAFQGCTMPGADEPFFQVPPGQMSVGLGVHGEPGICEMPMGTADQIADLLADAVLAEAPSIGTDGFTGRAIVLLNGLGTIKAEELYVVFRRVAERLTQAGITPVLPEVGELMTSLDMAGVSLTITYLDEELEELWQDPVDTIALRRGGVAERARRTDQPDSTTEPPIRPGTADSQAAAQTICQILDLMRHVAVQREQELAQLDSLAGDGDHGQGMRLGTTGASNSAQQSLAQEAGAGTLLARAGAQWAESAGGTSGAIWDTILTSIGRRIGDDDRPTNGTIVAAVNAAAEAVQTLGGAKPGDKTLVDALVPFATTLDTSIAQGESLANAWMRAAAAAQHAAEATAHIVSRLGRSHVLGEKSLGVPDPGATSFSILMKSIGQAKLLD